MEILGQPMGWGSGPVPPQPDLNHSWDRPGYGPLGDGGPGLRCRKGAVPRGVGWRAWGGPSTVRSVAWMNGQVDSGAAEQGSLHVRIAPIPQRFVGLLDDLGRRPPQDVVGPPWLVIGSYGKKQLCFSLKSFNRSGQKGKRGGRS